MADFLILVFIYIIISAVTAYIFLLGDSDYHRNGIVGKTRLLVVQIGTLISSYLIPGAIRDSAKNAVVHLLYTKNCYLQFIYLLLLLGISYIYTASVHPHMEAHHIPLEYSIAAYAMISINLILFLATGFTDPGVITRDNLSVYYRVYEFDGNMYWKENVCRTCGFDKPARSKHCAFCDRCVHRFDHHCSWVNNCIGARNVHYFVLLLISITLGSIYGAFVIGQVLVAMVRSKGIMEASYMGSDGKLYPVTKMIVFQHMFMRHPGMVFLLTSLCLLSILVGGFAAYHLYLAVTNQTTNERYKVTRTSQHEDVSQAAETVTNRLEFNQKRTARQRTNERSKVTRTSQHKDISQSADTVSKKLEFGQERTGGQRTRNLKRNYYSKGVLRNLYEVFFPIDGRSR